MATLALAFLACLAVTKAYGISSEDFLNPVPLQDVQLQYNSQFDKAVSLNKEYLLGLDSDRLLKTFRLNAGLDAPGEAFTGSWEDPSCEVRGQYLGHWLSGTAVLGKNTGDKKILDKASHIVRELRKVQEKLGGYLSAFPLEHFDRLRNLQTVWAPFYVIHKIMAGLLDQHLFLGNELALKMVVEEAEFFKAYIEDVIHQSGKDRWTQMLEVEYGGMEEVLFNLYAVTKNETWAKMAKHFTKLNFMLPLLVNVDSLPGRHANTHLAQVNGFAAGFETAGDQMRLTAVVNFSDIITHAHSYATGGSNSNEFWGEAYHLGPTIYPEGSGRDTEETCTTYNMLKIARYLFRWSGEAKYADYAERAVLNGILGVQRMPADYVSVSSRNTLTKDTEVPGNTPSVGSRRLRTMTSSNPHSTVLSTEPRSAWRKGTNGGQFSGLNSSIALPEAQAPSWRDLLFQRYASNSTLADPGNAPGPGVILYLLPLGAGNNKDDNYHHWSTPLNSFWCCSGSTSEQFGKLMDSIFFERKYPDAAAELYINQFTPSTLHWRLGGLDVTLNASLYDADSVARASVEFEPFPGPSDAAEVVVKLRIPQWTDVDGASVVLNDGEVVARGQDLKPESYLALKRTFKSGDKLVVELPMKTRCSKIEDYGPLYKNLQAIMIGPLVMAALTDGARGIEANPEDIASYIQPVSAAGIFSLAGPGNSILHQGDHSLVSLQTRSNCASLMACTFRLLTLSLSSSGYASTPLDEPSTNENVVIESLMWPGHYVTATKEGQFLTQQLPLSSVQTWSFSPPADGTGKRTLRLASHVRQAIGGIGPEAAELSVEAPLGSYPEGARLLKGRDRSFVIAPLGNIIEERYSPYLEFGMESGSVTLDDQSKLPSA